MEITIHVRKMDIKLLLQSFLSPCLCSFSFLPATFCLYSSNVFCLFSLSFFFAVLYLFYTHKWQSHWARNHVVTLVRSLSLRHCFSLFPTPIILSLLCSCFHPYSTNTLLFTWLICCVYSAIVFCLYSSHFFCLHSSRVMTVFCFLAFSAMKQSLWLYSVSWGPVSITERSPVCNKCEHKVS